MTFPNYSATIFEKVRRRNSRHAVTTIQSAGLLPFDFPSSEDQEFLWTSCCIKKGRPLVAPKNYCYEKLKMEPSLRIALPYPK